MNKREIIPIPDYIADILLLKIKSTGREMFYYFLAGVLTFFILIFLMNSFSKTLRFLIAFITGLALWVPFIGGFLERRNILADLKSGEMYLVKGFTETKSGFRYSGIIYEPLVEIQDHARAIYILPVSRYVAGFE